MCGKCEKHLKGFPHCQWLATPWASRHLSPTFAEELNIGEGNCVVLLPIHGTQLVHKDMLFAFKYQSDCDYFLEYVMHLMDVGPNDFVDF